MPFTAESALKGNLSANGNKVRVPCQEPGCKNTFEVPVRLRNMAKRCPDCRVIHRRELQRGRERYRPALTPLLDYRVTVDPDNSWGSRSFLSYPEILDLAIKGWLAQGTEFQKWDGRTLRYNGKRLEEVTG